MAHQLMLLGNLMVIATVLGLGLSVIAVAKHVLMS